MDGPEHGGLYEQRPDRGMRRAIGAVLRLVKSIRPNHRAVARTTLRHSGNEMPVIGRGGSDPVAGVRC